MCIEQYFPAQNTELEAYQQIEKDLLAAIQHAPDNTAGNKNSVYKIRSPYSSCKDLCRETVA